MKTKPLDKVGSAGFQPAVSPTSSRQPLELARTLLILTGAFNRTHARRSRYAICSIAPPIPLGCDPKRAVGNSNRSMKSFAILIIGAAACAAAAEFPAIYNTEKETIPF